MGIFYKIRAVLVWNRLKSRFGMPCFISKLPQRRFECPHFSLELWEPSQLSHILQGGKLMRPAVALAACCLLL